VPDLAGRRPRRDIHHYPQLFHKSLALIPQLVFSSTMPSTPNVSPINRIRASSSAEISAVDKNF
jgi:hypothetical protein